MLLCRRIAHTWPRARCFTVRSRPDDISYLRQLGRDDDHVTLYLPGDIRTPSYAASLSRTAVLELINPSARNAMSGKMMAELIDAVDQLEEHASSLCCVIVRGSGGHFCAGADLRVAKDHLSSPEGGATMSRVMTHALTRLRRLPFPSVAVVEGAAIGGGAEITTACDFRVLARSASIQFVHGRMGVSPGWGGGARLVQLVGRQRALRLLGRTEKVAAADAEVLGLADAVVEDNAVDAGAVSFVRPLNAHAPDVLQGIKRVLSHGDDSSLLRMLSTEHAVFQQLWGGPANVAALAKQLSNNPRTKS
ncbi:hypothetical protein H257_04712 [Aphanomyces astaci]|uniref:Ethylmalonyl-CoA decarboxylase n=2 Tax=Aphanomyces astaci TaxID=112090 RepID=W4GT76_APHAT|nr:hypothetical protein H257_04712 [Aphanomyces astaci]ETV82950.1 hypothetical protein H257_04712 [Aphanomyces astaci]|eukprot:XP_009827621.1 hypothetical protein H257_04712 [Aphanomyces astaci]